MDNYLIQLKAFLAYLRCIERDSTTDELCSMYDQPITISFLGATTNIHFDADSYSRLCDLLEETIEEEEVEY